MRSDLRTVEWPRLPGTYVLWLRVDAPRTIGVGRLGERLLAAGVYAYVGSAHGPGGLGARLRRHLRADKIHHWHIDALTACVPMMAIWYTTAPERLECTWAQHLARLAGVSAPVEGFGASDCRCVAHLFTVDHRVLRSAWDALGRPHTPASDDRFTFSV